jgi:hypothetical protein
MALSGLLRGRGAVVSTHVDELRLLINLKSADDLFETGGFGPTECACGNVVKLGEPCGDVILVE